LFFLIFAKRKNFPLALDMFRDLRLTRRKKTTDTLHYARCG